MRTNWSGPARLDDGTEKELGQQTSSRELAIAHMRSAPRLVDLSLLASLGLLLLGLGAGLSPFFFAYYGASVWVPIGLALVVAGAVGVIARPMRLSGPAVLALVGLMGLGVWSLSSVVWAESMENAMVGGNRWLAYGALLLLLLSLVRSDRRSAVLVGATALGVAAVALSVLARLLGPSPGALFLGARLNSPLGYINGEGCLFVIGFWLCFAAAESRRALVACLGAGMAALMACLAILTQSRGTALAMALALVAVVAAVPGRVRRIYGLFLVAGVVALAVPDLLHVYDNASAGLISVRTAHRAGRAALLAALGASLAWGALTLVWGSIVERPWGPRLRSLGSWLLAAPIVVALVLAVGSASRIDRGARDQWHAFTKLGQPSYGGGASSASQSRLLSGAGNRYDYWRIAWRMWREHPLLGVGAGNYQRDYYQMRATTEDIEQPHSVELQSLAELGLPGLSLFVCFVVGAAWGAFRMAKRARTSALSRALMVAALGAFVAWLVQTSVDWMHLLPGLTAIALMGAAVLVSPRSTAGSEKARPERSVSSERRKLAATRSGSRTSSFRTGALGGRFGIGLGASMAIAALVLAGASLSRQGVADFYRMRAERELDARPAVALSDIESSLEIDADAVPSYYVKASALARFDQARGAERALRAALAHEPDNYVTWALLGDVAVRQGRFSSARRDYLRAHQLNPRNSTLSKLAVRPSKRFRRS
jgi:Flp pilus assembly protein TadD